MISIVEVSSYFSFLCFFCLNLHEKQVVHVRIKSDPNFYVVYTHMFIYRQLHSNKSELHKRERRKS